MKFYSLYSRMPIFIQNIMCSIFGYKEARVRFNQDFKIFLSQLNKTDLANLFEINQIKKKNLINSLLNAKKHILYKDIMLDISEDMINNDPFAVLSKLPVINKDDIRSFDISKIKKSDDIVLSTSGTSGKALSICKDKKSIAMQWAIWFRHRSRFNIKFKDLSVNFTGKPIVPSTQTKPPFWRYNAAQNQYFVSSQHINSENINDIVNFLNSIKPSFYSGYPSILSDLSRLALSKGLSLNIDSKPKVIFSGAENMYEHQQNIIEKWTDAVITDQYGLTEGNCNFSKCEHGYYHEDFEFCHLELDNVEILPDNSMKGHLIGTAFYNESMPLIKYNTGDIAVFSSPSFKCPCGRESRVILSVEGRADDYIITPDGRRVMRFGYLFRDTFEAIEAQVIQEKPKEIIIRTVLSGVGDYKNFETKVEQQFNDHISQDMKLIFEYVDHIEKSPTGKFKAVLNKMK